MKKISILTALCLAGLSSGALVVSNVAVDSIRDTTASYGNIWTGIVTYDIASDTDSVWTWLELSTDNGNSWSQKEVHAIGHVGTVKAGTARKIRWMIDGDKGPDCRFRVRANDSAAQYRLTYYYVDTNVTPHYAYLDTVMDSVLECPKPFVQADPYEILERMLNNKEGMNLDMTNVSNKLPLYGHATAHPRIDFKVSHAQGEVVVGMGVSGRSLTGYGPNPNLKYRATYFRCGSVEFVMVNRNTIFYFTAKGDSARKIIQDSTGVPLENVNINWDHIHYTDNGEMGGDSMALAVRRAKAAARPAKMAFLHKRVGRGYNVRRINSAHGGITDGPIDDNLYAVLFKGLDDSVIGSWLRFTGHDITQGGQVQILMEQAYGGVCSFINGGSGTMSGWTNYEAGYYGQIGKYSKEWVVRTVMDTLSSLTFAPIGKLGVAYTRDTYYHNLGDAPLQAFQIGGYSFASYISETPVEQVLFTNARLEDFDRLMVLGYSNGGLLYYPWGGTLSAWDRFDIPRMAQITIRGVNILNHLLGE